MKSIVIILCCLFFFSSNLKANDSKNKVLLERVQSYMEHGEHKKALRLLDERLTDTPDDLALINQRASILVFIQKEKSALIDLKKATSIDPRCAETMLIYAQLKQNMGDIDSALWYLNQGLGFEARPNTLESLYSLKGNLLMRKDLYADAEDCLVKAAACPNVSQETMRNLASVLNANDKNTQAVAVLKETMEIFGHNEETLINAGYVSNQLGLYDDAIAYLDDALALDQDNPYTLANIAQSYLKIGGVEQAHRYINRSLTNDNTNPYAYRIKGDCYKASGEYERACKEYKKALKNGYSILYSQNEISILMAETCGRK